MLARSTFDQVVDWLSGSSEVGSSQSGQADEVGSLDDGYRPAIVQYMTLKFEAQM